MAEEVEFYRETEFKDTDIEKIPKGWSVSRIGGLVEVETGKRAKGGGLNEGTVASIGGEHIDNLGRIIWNGMKFIPNDFYDLLSQGKVKLGDILLVKDGATTGKVAMIKNLRYDKVAVNEHVFVLRSKTELLINDFLFYFLFSKFGQAQIKKRFHGIIGGITKDDLENCLLPMPPLNEQRKISEVLSTVDESIQKTDDIIAKTERLKKGLMQELLTKGIGHKEFKDTEIGKIPKEWEVVKLGELAVEVYRYPTYYDIKYVGTNEGVPEVRGELIKENGELEENLSEYRFISKETSQRFPKTILQEGDFVLSVRGTMGKVAIVPKFLEGANITANLMKVSLDRLKCYPPFFKQVFLSDFFRKTLNNISSQTTIKTVQAPRLKSIKMSVPPLHEQKKIAEILSTVDKKIEILKQEKVKLERIKQWFMGELLSGRIRVRVA
jgi:type I restriction enzyme S subunit